MVRYGYWVFGRDMLNVNLNTLKENGVTDIFLNYFAFEKYGQDKVLEWIKEANNKNINIHIWVQCFYDGEWHNPKTTNLTSKKNEIRRYANLNGVKGIHLDYLRYTGNAYKTSGGAEAITQFVREVRNENPKTFLTCAVMPENQTKYYYGQDIEALGKIVDAVIPMAYKGNYNQNTNWIKTITYNFAKYGTIWTGLQAYRSDNDTTLLSTTELKADINSATTGGAKGIVLFRYGLSNIIKMEGNNMIKTKLTVTKLTSASQKDYLLATLTDANNKPITNVKVGFADNGVKYIVTDNKGQARYFVDHLKGKTQLIKIKFFGDSKYEASNQLQYKIGKLSTSLGVKKLVSASKQDYLLATLIDENKNPVKRVNIGFADNGVKYVTADNNGQARYIVTHLKDKDAIVKIQFGGNDNYEQSNKVSIQFSKPQPVQAPPKKKYGHSTEHCCEDMGQNNGYYCACHSLQEVFRNLTNIVVPQGTIAGWAGTTSAGTSHQGIRTAIAKFNSKYGQNLQIEEKSFNDVGWSGIREIINSNNKDCIIHLLYQDQYGHYEVVNGANDPVNVQNSLGSKCNNGCYYGYIEYRSQSTYKRYINGISQKSIMVITNG